MVTWGSGSCPTVPAFYDSADASVLIITLEFRESEVCSADMSASTSTVSIPAGVEGIDEVRIESERVDVEPIG